MALQQLSCLLLFAANQQIASWLSNPASECASGPMNQTPPGGNRILGGYTSQQHLKQLQAGCIHELFSAQLLDFLPIGTASPRKPATRLPEFARTGLSRQAATRRPYLFAAVASHLLKAWVRPRKAVNPDRSLQVKASGANLQIQVRRQPMTSVFLSVLPFFFDIGLRCVPSAKFSRVASRRSLMGI